MYNTCLRCGGKCIVNCACQNLVGRFGVAESRSALGSQAARAANAGLAAIADVSRRMRTCRCNNVLYIRKAPDEEEG